MAVAKQDLKTIIKQQYAKAAADPVHFMKKYCRIQHPVEGLIPFSLWEFQEDVLKDFQTNRYNIVLKSRQLGLSTLISGYCLWMMLFHENKTILVIATKTDVAMNLITKVNIMHENLPSWMKGKLVADNKKSMEFSNGSSIKATSSKPESARSEALSLLVIDEAAFVDKASEVWTAASMTLATGGDAIILSCVTEDTMVLTNRGPQHVSSFVDKNKEGGYQIDEYSVLGKDKLRNGTLFHNNGNVETKILKTKLSEIEGSYNHKLWACKDGKYDWFRLDELSVGDWVNVQYGMNVWGNDDDVSDFIPTVSNKIKNAFSPDMITPEIAYFLGLYLSEGSAHKVYGVGGDLIGGSITITCGDDVAQHILDAGLSYSTHDNLHYNISSKNLIEFMEYLGFDLAKHAHEKIIPNRLLQLSKKNISALLRGIFDGDGFSRSDRGTVGISLSNERLINQIRFLLLNLGIRSAKYTVSADQMNSYGYFDYEFNHDVYRLELNDHNSRLFYDTIGFGLRRKDIHKVLLIDSRGTSKDVIPFSLDTMHDLYDLYDGNLSTLRLDHGLSLNGILNKTKRYKTDHISSKNVYALYDVVKNRINEELIDKLDGMLIENSEWVQITSIEDSVSDTYDFSLPDVSGDKWAHSVVYNGILGHQTPNGIGNFFHKMWIDAKSGANDFTPIKLHWTVHPERDQAWRDEQDRNLGERQAAQECDCLWGKSIVTVRDSETGEILEVNLEDLYEMMM